MPDGSYDYVIVGAGSAGAVLAARLSEDPAVTVCLLEAGGEADADEVMIPAAFGTLFKTRWDWNYETTEQKQLNGRRAYWPRMKALGGCSSMNAMIYIRGNRADYDSWRDQYGAAGWGFDDVLPYFVKAEGNTRLGGPLHGQKGPLRVEDRVYTHELSHAFVDSAVSAGLKPTDDFNGAEQEGAGLYQVTCRKGRRWSVNEAYLKPARSRPNLTVETGAFATRIELDGSGGSSRATGVTFRQAGAEHTVHATREVLLSGGAVNSPQLLMLSGIGPASHLAEVGVESKVDLGGVGANLQDHPAAGWLWYTKDTTDLAQLNNVRNFVRWKARGTGPLASNIGEAGAFFGSRDDLVAPDIQIHTAPAGFYDNGLHEPTRSMVTVATTLVGVASRGSIRLRSADPGWHPAIDSAYFDDPADLDAMLAGMKRSWEIATQGALAAYLDSPWQVSASPTDEETIEHVRTWTQTLYHPTSTCAMGSGEDAVVDPELRVRGVEALRVVDASVMPAVVRGNTNAPTIMIGEKAADLIKESLMTATETSTTTFESLNPRTGDVVGHHPVSTPEEVQAAVDRAHEEAAWWGALSFDEREKHLQTWKGAMTRRVAQLAEVMHQETGKPHGDAMLEAALAIDHLAWAASHAEKVLKRRKVSSGLVMANQAAYVEYQPLGVVGVIGPWNYPVFTPMGSIGYALAAGNAVVFKPSEYTPGVGEWLARTFLESVGRPVLQVVTGFGETGHALCTSGVNKVAFTGSTATGKLVMAACAETLTPVVIEAGGKDALLVDSDADLEAAADAAIWGACSNAGQTCTGVERVYVHERVYDEFLSTLTAKAREVTAYDGADSKIGPITMPKQLDVIRRHIDDALARGGRAVVGGSDAVGERYVQPTVLVDVPEDSEAVQEETFGPTVTVARVKDMDEAVERTNATRYGLGSTVFSKARGMELASRIRSGMTAVNGVITFAAIPSLPFGGVGDSGFGRIHGPDGLKEFTFAKAIARQRFKPLLALTTFGRTEKADQQLASMITMLHGRGTTIPKP